MPRSKRARLVHTSKVTKNRKERVSNLFTNVQAAVEAYDYIWVFDVQNMRNNFIKEIRTELSDSRIFMGKNRVLALALGASPNNPSKTPLLTTITSPPSPGTSLLTPHLHGSIGLLFTSRPPQKVQSYFANYTNSDYARAGTVAPRAFHLAPGELYTRYGVDGGEEDPLPLGVEPTLRKLGVPSRVRGGRVVLEGGGDAATGGEEAGMDGGGGEGLYTVCKEGDVLDSRQTSILKIFGVRMAEFRVGLRAVWSKSKGTVEDLDPGRGSGGGGGGGEMAVDDEGEEDDAAET
ncbi:MAG: hypothetical protein Q9160_002354 [Pyrenula sp. 1 TL-2023]